MIHETGVRVTTPSPQGPTVTGDTDPETVTSYPSSFETSFVVPFPERSIVEGTSDVRKDVPVLSLQSRTRLQSQSSFLLFSGKFLGSLQGWYVGFHVVKVCR